MRKKLYISLIALATLITLGFSVVPHHHNEDGSVCLIISHCDEDNYSNDEHHRHSDESAQHEQSCISESDYIVNTENSIKHRVLSCNNCEDSYRIYISSILFHTTDVSFYVFSRRSGAKSEYGERISFYKSAEVTHLYGLRAPPFFA